MMVTRTALHVLAVWAIIAALQLWLGWPFVTSGLTDDPDSVMRLVEVHDWLGGQGWFDLHQYRIGPQGGVAMHWTRIADLLPATFIAIARPIVGTGIADRIAMTATPLLLLLAAVALTLSIVRALSGRSAPGIVGVVLATSFGAMVLFVPGDIDHHNIQLIAVLALLRATVGERTRSAGIAAAIAIVISLVVGIETVPVIVAIFGSLALLWVSAPSPERAFVEALGVGLVVSAIAALLLFMPRPWPADRCDGWTLPLFWISAELGVTALIASRIGKRGVVWRFVLPTVVGSALIGLTVFFYPACRVHPAGTDPLLWTYWMDTISENQSLRTIVVTQGWGGALTVAGVVPGVLIAVILHLRAQPGAWRRWLPAIAALVAALGVTILHVRGQAIMSGIAACLAAALLVRASVRPGLVRIVAWAGLLPLPWILAGATFARSDNPDALAAQTACGSPAVMAMLDRLPPATFVVPMSVDPQLLAMTRHRSFGATYHRNAQGNHAMIAAMIGTPADARARLQFYHVGYLLDCDGYGTARYAKDRPGSFAHMLVIDRPPPWLVPLARFPQNVRLYRVD